MKQSSFASGEVLRLFETKELAEREIRENKKIDATVCEVISVDVDQSETSSDEPKKEEVVKKLDQEREQKLVKVCDEGFDSAISLAIQHMRHLIGHTITKGEGARLEQLLYEVRDVKKLGGRWHETKEKKFILNYPKTQG